MPSEHITVDDIDRAPGTIGQPQATPDMRNMSEALSEIGRLSSKVVELEIEYDRLLRANEAHAILNQLITPYASKTFWFMCIYCSFVGLVLLANAVGSFKLPISDGVMQILVGSTAVTVIGLVGMVLTGIFVGARKRHDS
jgi:hypothetical protein